jgi:hypothetical protein
MRIPCAYRIHSTTGRILTCTIYAICRTYSPTGTVTTFTFTHHIHTSAPLPPPCDNHRTWFRGNLPSPSFHPLSPPSATLARHRSPPPHTPLTTAHHRSPPTHTTQHPPPPSPTNPTHRHQRQQPRYTAQHAKLNIESGTPSLHLCK